MNICSHCSRLPCVSLVSARKERAAYASSPVCPPALANNAALSRLDLAECTRLSATSRLNNDRIPSSLEFMIAAFAANSVVGGGPGAACPGITGVPGRDALGVSWTLSEFEFASGLVSGGFVSAVEVDFAEKGDGIAETGMRMTFLNVDKKSRLSASRLMLLMKNDSVAASSSRILGASQHPIIRRRQIMGLPFFPTSQLLFRTSFGSSQAHPEGRDPRVPQKPGP